MYILTHTFLILILTYMLRCGATCGLHVVYVFPFRLARQLGDIYKVNIWADGWIREDNCDDTLCFWEWIGFNAWSFGVKTTGNVTAARLECSTRTNSENNVAWVQKHLLNTTLNYIYKFARREIGLRHNHINKGLPWREKEKKNARSPYLYTDVFA